MGTKMRNTGIVVAALVVSITSGLLLGFGLWRTATKIEDNRSCWQSNSLGLERMAGEVQAMLQRLSRTQSQGDRERLIKDIGQDRDRLWTRVTHEDDLISQRLGWMLTIQAFLFAAFGVTVGKEAQESFRRFVTPTVCVFGWVSCLSIGYMLAVGRGVLKCAAQHSWRSTALWGHVGRLFASLALLATVRFCSVVISVCNPSILEKCADQTEPFQSNGPPQLPATRTLKRKFLGISGLNEWY